MIRNIVTNFLEEATVALGGAVDFEATLFGDDKQLGRSNKKGQYPFPLASAFSLRNFSLEKQEVNTRKCNTASY